MKPKSELLRDLVLLSRAAEIVLQEQVLQSLEGVKLGPTRSHILRLLRHQGKQTVNDIARFLGQTKAAASQNVESLVKAGLVRRESDREDRRCVWVSLTPRGARLVRELEKRQRDAFSRAVEGMSEAEIRSASKNLQSLAERLLKSSEVASNACLQCCSFEGMECVYRGGPVRCPYLHGAEEPTKT